MSEDAVLRNLEALAAARDEIPVEIVQIDDGYQRSVGDWLEANEKFPRGIAPLAAEIRSAGFTPGIWTAPFCAVAESHLFATHADWMLRQGGEPFCGLLHRQWSADAAVFVLDTGRDEVIRHLESVFRELVGMGFRYLKLDFLYAAALRGESIDRFLSRAERLRRGLDAVRSGAGEEAFLLGCGCPLGAAVGAVDGMRIGPDVAPIWRPDPSAGARGIEESIPATRNAVRNALSRAWMHRRLWQNDPDCLVAVGGDAAMTSVEARTLAAVIAATGGMALFSADLPGLSREHRELVRETFELARSVDALGIPGAARVVDLLGDSGVTRVACGDAEGGIVAFVTGSDGSDHCSVALAPLGLARMARAPEPLLGSRPGRVEAGRCLEVDLAPHESALFRVRQACRLAVFCDFDGTFSVQDVGSTLVRRHAGLQRTSSWERYERGELSAWEYNLQIFDGFRVPRTEVDAFLRTVELDPGARDLVRWCARNGVPFRVLSDGFDYNLNRLQLIQNVRFVYDANRLRFDAGVWRIEAGSQNPDCDCGTGTCKRSRIEAFRRQHPGVTTVHIGNGRVSDTCGALAADVTFAKDSLAGELTRRGVHFEDFTTLLDVIPRLDRLLASASPP